MYKFIIRYYITTAMLILFLPVELNSRDGFKLHVDDRYKYSIMLPVNWEKTTLDLVYKKVIILNNGINTELKISITENTDSENNKWKSWKNWYIKGIGSNLRVIVERKKLNLDINIKGKLLVFQYYSNGIKFLQRILINRFKNYELVIECRSPVRTFYYYDTTFNMVMNSLQLND